MPDFPDRLREAPGPSALLRLAKRAQRHPHGERPRVSPVVIEEEAASLLYGERSGTVNASPVGAPVDRRR